MNGTRSNERHLLLRTVVLKPGQEWHLSPSGWKIVRVQHGAGYWLESESAHGVDAGSVLLLGHSASGKLRASQLGEVQLIFFRIQTELLAGLATLGEQRSFEMASSRMDSSFQLFPAAHSFAIRCGNVLDARAADTLSFRLELLRLFLDAFGNKRVVDQEMDASSPAARARLRQILEQMTASELLEVSFSDLARRMNCTPRHLSRVFSEVVGMSFREKQAKLRLARARELLAHTQTKVVDVALESGFQSPSLFNLMFRKRFGMSPGQWRRRNQPGHTIRRQTLSA